MTVSIETLPPKPAHPMVRKPVNGRPAKPPRRRFAKLAAALCVIALVSGAGWWWWQSRQTSGAPRFETRPVDRGSIRQTVLTTGTLQPRQTVTVGSQISGQILAVYVNYNSPVKKGQLLARLDPSTQLAQREQARADVANADGSVQSADASIHNASTGVDAADATIDAARAAVTTSQTGRLTAAAQLEQARTSVNKAKVQLALDRLTYDRNVNLFKRDLIATADLDTARATWQKAQADVQNAQAQEDVARAGVASASSQIGNAQALLESAIAKRGTASAQVQAAQAQRNQAVAQRRKATASLGQNEVNLGYADIRSPVDGVVISRLVDPGQTVAASFQTPALFTIATDLRRMQAKANVDESDISRIFVGQQVSFTVNAWAGQVFRGGRVTLIRNAPQTVQNVVTYEVLIDIDNDALKLRPGMTASLTLLVAERPDALRVPNAALRFRPDEAGLAVTVPRLARGVQRVWMKDGTTLRPQDIKVGISDGATSEVVSGELEAGDEVVVGVTSTKAGAAKATAPSAAPSAGASRTRSQQIRIPH